MKLILNFNGEQYEKRPKSEDDVKEAILSVKPETMLTEMYITFKRGTDVRERKLPLHEARQLFINEQFLEVFVLNLIIK